MQKKQAAPSIVTVIGIESAQAISKVFGGTTVYIPKLSTLSIRMRNRQICEEYDAGVKVSQLSAKYDLSDRRVWSILKTPL
jgi:Mor family transcriptional regulator